MKLQIFCVLDKAVQAYLPPFFTRSKGEALRSFSEACNDEKHQFHRHSSDYVLFFMGEFDDGSGLFSGSEPVRIISAMECLVEDPFSKDKEIGESEPTTGVSTALRKRLPI